jgi:hypothetical protein
MADFSLLIMENRHRINAIITPPIILNIMSNVVVEESFEVVEEVPLGFAPDEPEAAGGLVVLVIFPPVAFKKKGYNSYRTVQLPNID